MPDPQRSPETSSNPLTLAGARAPMAPEEALRAAKSISRALRRAANKSRLPSTIIIGGGGFQARRGDHAFRLGLIASFLAFVLAPFVGASLYWGLLASKQYVTESKFALRSGENSLQMDASGLPSAAAPNANPMQDAQAVVDFVRSRAIVEALDKKLGLREMFSRDGVDYFSRFDPADPVEDLAKYWNKRVDASYDLISGIISVHVRAFTPEDSLAIMNTVVDLSEKVVNDMSDRSRRDALALARTELGRAEEQLKNATGRMRDARNAEGVLDAPAAAEAITNIITQLRTELSAAQESLALQKSAAAVNSPQMRLTQAKVRSLQNQIAEYSAQIAGDNKTSGDTLAQHAGVLSQYQMELALAQQRYALAANNFETARVATETQRAYLVSFLRPTLAEKSIYPRRWLEWSIIVAPATLAWGVLVGIAFLVRDHMAK